MTGHDRLLTFADETKTGAGNDARFRGGFKAIIAACVDDREDLGWADYLLRQHGLTGVEVKSATALTIADSDADFRRQFLSGLASCTIYIIDFVADVEDLFKSFEGSVQLDPYDLLAGSTGGGAPNPSLLPPLRDFLRRLRAEHHRRMPIGRIQSLVEEALGGLRRRYGGDLVAWPDVDSMKPQEQQEFLVRAAVAFGEVLDPERQAALWQRQLPTRFSMMSSGQWASKVLEDVLAPDRIYDDGNLQAFEKLQAAHAVATEAAQAYLVNATVQASRPGTLKQDDSRAVVGLRVADWAAAVARREYESHPTCRREGATALAKQFKRVLFNDGWMP